MKTRRSIGDKIVVDSNTKARPPKERPVNETKYIGMDVHMAMTVIAVLNSVGKVVAEAIIETKASAIVDFLKSQRGTVHVTFEEGTQAAWLYDLIHPNKIIGRSRTRNGNMGDDSAAPEIICRRRDDFLDCDFAGGF